jgi:hypothetical protein
MTRFAKLLSVTALGACFVLGNTGLWAADAPKKNWTPPAQKIYGE